MLDIVQRDPLRHWDLCCASSFALLRIIIIQSLPALVMPLMALIGARLLLASFIKGASLRNAVVMALPDDDGVGWESEEALDCLSGPC
jgi:hypothetical protein